MATAQLGVPAKQTAALPMASETPIEMLARDVQQAGRFALAHWLFRFAFVTVTSHSKEVIFIFA